MALHNDAVILLEVFERLSGPRAEALDDNIFGASSKLCWRGALGATTAFDGGDLDLERVARCGPTPSKIGPSGNVGCKLMIISVGSLATLGLASAFASAIASDMHAHHQRFCILRHGARGVPGAGPESDR